MMILKTADVPLSDGLQGAVDYDEWPTDSGRKYTFGIWSEDIENVGFVEPGMERYKDNIEVPYEEVLRRYTNILKRKIKKGGQ